MVVHCIITYNDGNSSCTMQARFEYYWYTLFESTHDSRPSFQSIHMAVIARRLVVCHNFNGSTYVMQISPICKFQCFAAHKWKIKFYSIKTSLTRDIHTTWKYNAYWCTRMPPSLTINSSDTSFVQLIKENELYFIYNKVQISRIAPPNQMLAEIWH